MSTSQNYFPEFMGRVLGVAGLMHLGARDILVPGDATVLDADFTLYVKLTSPQPLTIPLPAPSTLSTMPGSRKIRVFDVNGNAGANAITVDGNGALIDGFPTALINGNFGGLELEWQGNHWHAVGSNFGYALTQIQGFAGMDAPPQAANADDDEFNNGVLAPEWELFGFVTLDPDPPARGESGGMAASTARLSTTQRQGWVLIQVSPDNSAAILHKPLLSAMTEGMIYTKFSMDSNENIAATDSISLFLCQSVLSGSDYVPDFDNMLSVQLNRKTSDNTWTLQAGKTVASLGTVLYNKSLDSFTQPVTRLAIARSGTTFRFYAISESGGVKHLADTTALLNPDRVAISCNNSVDPAPVYGVDYIRRVDGAYPTF